MNADGMNKPIEKEKRKRIKVGGGYIGRQTRMLEGVHGTAP